MTAPPPRRDSHDEKDRSAAPAEDSKPDQRLPPEPKPKTVESVEPPAPAEIRENRAPAQDAKPEVAPPEAAEAKVEVKEAPTEPPGPRPDEPQDEATLIPDFTRSSDEDEDEGVIFSQEFLNERKEIFENDMRALKAELPPPPLEDPVIVQLLLKIQLLGMVAEGVLPEEKEEPPEPMEVDKPAEEQPVATKEEKEVEDQVARPVSSEAAPLRTTPDVEKPTVGKISVENLPFLNSGPPTPLSDLEVFQENIRTHERFKETLRAKLAEQRRETSRKNAELRDEFVSIYKPWRMEVHELDRQRDRKAVTPLAGTPPGGTTPAEGRRHKGNTELDFQNALKASEISAQEELERRRERETATAFPDLAKEAVIPDMLEPHEKQAGVYKDTNNIVDPADAFEVFGFYPPPDDFTPEEHKMFTDAFMTHPKKWGKIAEALPGRDFRQCIMHYYLTKEEIKYKAKLNKRWSRRGRTRRSARPKSNALMADLGVVKPDYDGEEEPTPVTDTGRPRRAAAPTFGESNNDAEHGNGRRGNANKDGDPTEKATRRSGRTGAGARGGRRGKAAQQQEKQQQQQQQEKQEKQEKQQQAAEAKPAAAAPAPATAPPSELETPLDGTAETERAKEQHDRETDELLPRTKATRARGKEGVYVFEQAEEPQAPKAETGYGSLQPTSYWSVPEVRDFPVLLAHFGRDFEGISSFMKTKTTIMVGRPPLRPRSTF